jgi:hypothetical protein
VATGRGITVSEKREGRLAVARLMEAGAQAAAWRPVAAQPLQGYCLLTGDEESCRITVYLENGQTHTALLEGALVWLPQEPGVLTIPVVPGAEPVRLPDPIPSPVAFAEPWSHLLSGAGEPVATMLSAQSDEDADVVSGAESTPDESDENIPEDVEVVGEAEPEPKPDVVGFKLYPEPAIPVEATVPAAPETPVAAAALTVPLDGRHPLAPRAGGSANIQVDGRVILHARGLPTPAALGRDEATGRPLNAYRAWLLSQRTGLRHDLGLLARVWGENFRLHSDGGLPLERFDSVLVTAEDRSGEQGGQTAPHVLLGTYQLPQE